MFSVYSIELQHEHEHGMVGYMGNGTVKNVFSVVQLYMQRNEDYKG